MNEGLQGWSNHNWAESHRCAVDQFTCQVKVNPDVNSRIRTINKIQTITN